MGIGDMARHVGTRETPQSEPAPGKEQVKNDAGGYVFAVDKWMRLERFLILGCEGGSYYASESKLTKENAGAIIDCAQEDAQRTVDLIVAISDGGRAAKNDAAIFALAVLAGQPHAPISEPALAALQKVCRIGTHLFQFAECIEYFRGWGRGLKRAVAAWYLDKTPRDLAYQVTKYQQRGGWSHRDLLRLAHPKAPDKTTNAIFGWIVSGKIDEENLPESILAFEEARKSGPDEIAPLIRKHKLVREVIPTEHLNRPDVWEAMLETMPITAMIRNLGKMSSIGLLAPMSQASKLVVERLGDMERLKKGRVHPIAVLTAMKIYDQGKGMRGSLSWNAVPQVTQALDDAFYLAFDTIESTGKNWLYGIDISSSMGDDWGSGIPNSPLTCAEVAAAMAMVSMRTEPNYYCHGFGHTFVDLGLRPEMTLGEVLAITDSNNFGGTDCSIPMQFALENNIDVDVFTVYTDNQTWAGDVHPFQALKTYREKMNKPTARLVVVGCEGDAFSIADPDDAGMLDVVGFDTAVPSVIADFARD